MVESSPVGRLTCSFGVSSWAVEDGKIPGRKARVERWSVI